MTSPSPQPHRHSGRAIGLALVAVIVQVVGTTALAPSASLDLLGYGLLAGGGLALAVRRRLPVVSLVFAAAATVAYHVLDYPHSVTTFMAVALAALAAGKAKRSGAIQATALLSYAAWVYFARVPWGQALKIAAWALGIAFLGYVVVNVVRMVAKLAKEQQRLSEERKRRQASEERLRIATELHDVLGHHLSLINVRAGVGLHLMDRQPEQARAALDTIREASAEALREVRSVLDALYPTGEGAPRAPAPRLALLAELTADAGLQVHTTISGEPRPLPAEIDRSAYRIVQEALTNVRRHAGPGATATIIIEYREDHVMVQVDDDGGAGAPAAEPAVEGNGIGGMRERAAALGGTLSAGPLLDGGWRVLARLPLPSTSSSPPPEAPSTPEGAP
jgi:signal transduction histidine kinase